LSYDIGDTIAAIASAPGGAFRGVVRLSGPDVIRCLVGCFQPHVRTDLRRVRRAQVIRGRLRVVGAVGAVPPLPCQLYLWPTSRSYTRQPVAELHTLGSPPLLDAVLRTLCAAGARLAEPGEFTLRAFLAGRIDLTQAEAVLGVIDAADPRQLDGALAQLAGGVARPIATLREELLELLAHIEAGLDFVEEDIAFVSEQEVQRRLAAAADCAAGLARQMAERGLAGTNVRVVLTGQPNVGKSSLLNALAGRAVALTSHQPGTTRDTVSARLDLDGLECELIDTAGLSVDAPADGPERAARALARTERDRALVQVFCVDAGRPLSNWERAQLAANATCTRLVVLTKADRPRATDLGRPAIATSSRTLRGIGQLRQCLRQAVAQRRDRDEWAVTGPVVAATAARCREG